MVMERLADFVSKSLEGGEAPAPPPEPGDADDADDVEVDITELEDKAPPPKRPRNWLLSPVPAHHCKREQPPDDDDDHRHGELLSHSTSRRQWLQSKLLHQNVLNLNRPLPRP